MLLIALSWMFHTNTINNLALRTDGVRGVDCIRKAGGKVIIQTPDTCEFPDLPSEVIRQRNADVVATPEQMPSIIGKMA